MDNNEENNDIRPLWKRPHISDQNRAVEFITVWQRATCIRDVADYYTAKGYRVVNLELTRFAGYLRRGNVPLKKFPRYERSIRWDWNGLANVAMETYMDNNAIPDKLRDVQRIRQTDIDSF